MPEKIEVSDLSASIRRTLLPIEQASGLANQAYADPALFAFEREHVMARTWTAIAFERELPEPGFALPVDLMGLPLLILRNRAGQLSVFHNVCSHRGMLLVREPGVADGSLRCPYHSWRYDLDGNLRGTPHIGGVGIHQLDGFDCDQHGLKEVRSHIWLGMVFVNLSGEAESFADFIRPLQQRWQVFTNKFEELRTPTNGGTMELEVNCNWKLAVENYCEAYHLPWVHPGLNSYSPLDQHYCIQSDQGMSGQGSGCYRLAEVAGNQLPQFPDWPAAQQQTAEYLSLYPNVLLGVQVDHVFAIILHPLSHDRTLESLQLFYVGDDAVTPSYAENRDNVLQAWREVFAEDIFAVEGMQQGRRSPGFAGGVFSAAMDGPTYHFHRWVAEFYASGLSVSAPGEGTVADRM